MNVALRPQPSPRNILSLCAGVGGLELGILLALRYRGEAGRGICYVEREAAAAASLVASMEAGWLHPAPVWSDMLSFDARPWRGLVHILASGDPCQDNSVAGKRAGSDGERFLAPEVCRLAAECRPDIIFRENVPGNADGQLNAIVPPLEGLGYRVAAGIFSSAETGNTMRRERLFIMAERIGDGHGGWIGSGENSGAAFEAQGARDQRQWLRGVSEREGADGGDELAVREDEPGRLGARPEREYVSDAGGRSGELARSIGHIEAGWEPDAGEAAGGRPRDAESERRGREMGSAIGGGNGRFAADEGWGSIERAAVDRAGGGSQRQMVGTACQQLQGRDALEAGRPRRRATSTRASQTLPPAVIPGPTDSRWIDVLDRFPELQPALSEEEAQSHLRRGIDAMAHRVERLRATGNGVDPLVAAYAFLSLDALLREGTGAGGVAVRWAA